MVTKAYKIYGELGTAQKMSFNKSSCYDFSEGSNKRILTFCNSDITGTNDYCVLVISCNSIDQCISELNGQISDGFFENIKTGEIVEIF